MKIKLIHTASCFWHCDLKDQIFDATENKKDTDFYLLTNTPHNREIIPYDYMDFLVRGRLVIAKDKAIQVDIFTNNHEASVLLSKE